MGKTVRRKGSVWKDYMAKQLQNKQRAEGHGLNVFQSDSFMGKDPWKEADENRSHKLQRRQGKKLAEVAYSDGSTDLDL